MPQEEGWSMGNHWGRCARLGVATVVLLGAGSATAQELTREQKEQFLRTAKVIRTRPASKGITGVLRATLQSEDGSLTHDAAFQKIDDKKTEFKTDRGTEINFRDSYKFNLAAYKLSLMLGLDMIPPHVERVYSGSTGSLSWWVDDVMMDEGEMTKKKVKPPNQNEYNAQYSIMQIFNQLIYNVDPNVGNMVITKDWKIWMIDQSRAFRLHETLENPKLLNMCERGLLARMKALDEESLKRELGEYLTAMEIKGLLKRRDKIVAFFDKQGPAKLYSFSGKP
jgi:hypothetical protein